MQKLDPIGIAAATSCWIYLTENNEFKVDPPNYLFSKNTNSNKVGVAQVLSRLTYISSLSHLRRINTPIDKSGKLVPPRKLHNTQWGFVCAAETPEGQSVGVVKNLAMMSYITHDTPTAPIYHYLQSHITPLEKIAVGTLERQTKIFVNGTWIGVYSNLLKITSYLKALRRRGLIDSYTSICGIIARRELWIYTDAGRIVRPVYRVYNNRMLFLSSNLILEQSASHQWMSLFSQQA